MGGDGEVLFGGLLRPLFNFLLKRNFVVAFRLGVRYYIIRRLTKQINGTTNNRR